LSAIIYIYTSSIKVDGFQLDMYGDVERNLPSIKHIDENFQMRTVVHYTSRLKLTGIWDRWSWLD
jgi:hypothetical protein